jgi:hypothetical protein
LAAVFWVVFGTLPFGFVYLWIAQPAHIAAAASIAYLAASGPLVATSLEVVTYLFFSTYATAISLIASHEQTKLFEQVAKFALVYPVFYEIGRILGRRFAQSPLPYGYAVLWALLAIQFAVQYFNVPYIHLDVPFMQDALYGTFKERNWLALYFFLAAYVLFLREAVDVKQIAKFLALLLTVSLLSGSKSILLAGGMAIALQTRASTISKIGLTMLVAIVYVMIFAGEFSQEKIDVRLEEERGAALWASFDLLYRNMWGYGFGFVESYFANLPTGIKGLGEGVNAIFCSPLDLMLIAGPFGLMFWLVFFCGIGLGAWRQLAPVAVWSLLNPLHQSEIAYFFIGWIVSQAAVQSMTPISAVRTKTGAS